MTTNRNLFVQAAPGQPAQSYAFEMPFCAPGTMEVCFDLQASPDAVGTICFNSALRCLIGAEEHLMPIAFGGGTISACNETPRAFDGSATIVICLAWGEDGGMVTVTANGQALCKTAVTAPTRGGPMRRAASGEAPRRIGLDLPLQDISILGVLCQAGEFRINNLSCPILGGVDGETLDEVNPRTTPSGRVFAVGPNRAYKTVQAVVHQLRPGDVVEVDGGTVYPGNVHIAVGVSGTRERPIVIRGLNVNGKRPVFYTAGGKYLFECFAHHYVLENLELKGNMDAMLARHGMDHDTYQKTVPMKQKRLDRQGVNFFGVHHGCDNLLVDNCEIYDTRQGVIGSDYLAGDITVRRCHIHHHGVTPGEHNMYLATCEALYPAARSRVERCYIHDSQCGNGLKTRSARNEIYENWFEGNYYQSLELIGPDPGYAEDRGYLTADNLRKINPDYGDLYVREDSDVVGNVIIHNVGACVRCGGDGTGTLSMDENKKGPGHGHTWGRYRFVNNTFLHRNTGEIACIRVEFAVESLEFYNNCFAYAPADGVAKKYDVIAVCNDGILNDVQWAAGIPLLAGANNWVPAGAIGVPDEWVGTRTEDPGLMNMAVPKGLALADNSPLRDAGVAIAATQKTDWPDWARELPEFGPWSPDGSRVLGLFLTNEAEYQPAMVPMRNADNAFPRPRMTIYTRPVNPETMVFDAAPATGAVTVGALQ